LPKGGGGRRLGGKFGNWFGKSPLDGGSAEPVAGKPPGHHVSDGAKESTTYDRVVTPTDAFEIALERAEATVRDYDTASGRYELGGLYCADDRFDAAQRQWELAFRMFRDDGQFREAARLPAWCR
jgi:hypothetical protein